MIKKVNNWRKFKTQTLSKYGASIGSGCLTEASSKLEGINVFFGGSVCSSNLAASLHLCKVLSGIFSTPYSAPDHFSFLFALASKVFDAVQSLREFTGFCLTLIQWFIERFSEESYKQTFEHGTTTVDDKIPQFFRS